VKAKLDENLGRSCAALLAASGHDISTVPEQGMSSWPDEQVLGACLREGRTLVTLDLDFSNPLRFPPEDTPGIVVLRLPSPVMLGQLKAALASLDAALATRSVAGKLWIVQPGAVREYEGKRG
jgi:predicted nuclease of predicted toxin-antitoxin system